MEPRPISNRKLYFYDLELSKMQYDYYLYLKKIDKKCPKDRILKQMQDHFDELKALDFDELKKMLNITHISNFNIFNNVITELNSEKGRNELLNFIKRPLTYLNSNPFPFFKDRSGEKWIKEEDELLIFLTKDQKSINFQFLSLCFPGRSGKQIHSHFIDLIKKGEIADARIKLDQDPTNFLFFKHVEESISKEIKEDISLGIKVTTDSIIDKAQKHYYDRNNFAERAAYKYFQDQKLKVYKIDKEDGEYTEDFVNKIAEIQGIIDELDELKKELVTNEEEAQIQRIAIEEEIAMKYNLPKPKFSDKWIINYMKRNRMSWRKAHYARRSAIDEEYAGIYLHILADAICTYSWEYVFNMDETSVRINNGLIRTIAPIGLSDIVIDEKRNDKECFTAIGTCNVKGTANLIVLSKGGDKACDKFAHLKNVEIWPTYNENGWMNESIMLRYLEYFHVNIAKHQPCALVLDCYKAHHTLAVIKRASELNIQLIFVPANGTSLYQPLDRKIFGIVKTKLRSLARSNSFSGPERFKIITEHLIQAWSEVTEKNLISAWKIPGLHERINLISNPNEQVHQENSLINGYIQKRLEEEEIGGIENIVLLHHSEEEEENEPQVFETYESDEGE